MRRQGDGDAASARHGRRLGREMVVDRRFSIGYRSGPDQAASALNRWPFAASPKSVYRAGRRLHGSGRISSRRPTWWHQVVRRAVDRRARPVTPVPGSIMYRRCRKINLAFEPPRADGLDVRLPRNAAAGEGRANRRSLDAVRRRCSAALGEMMDAARLKRRHWRHRDEEPGLATSRRARKAARTAEEDSRTSMEGPRAGGIDAANCVPTLWSRVRRDADCPRRPRRCNDPRRGPCR